MADQEREIDRLSRKLQSEQAGQPAAAFNYQTIAKDLDEIPQRLLDAIGKEKCEELQAYETGVPHVLALTVAVSGSTWQSIRFLCWEVPEIGWQPEFAFAVPPLARTLLDSLFNIIYMFDEPAQNVHWFLANGWTDQVKEHKRLHGTYGKDPMWATWFETSAAEIKQMEEELVTLTPAERARPEKPAKGWWPNPGAMLRQGLEATKQDRNHFLGYLNDWFYRELSGDSHLSLSGLLHRGGHFLPLAEGINRNQLLGLARSKFILNSLTLYVALLSEISVELSLDREKAKLREIWTKLVPHRQAEGLFKQRYEKVLQ